MADTPRPEPGAKRVDNPLERYVRELLREAARAQRVPPRELSDLRRRPEANRQP
jgi:hypothetical protein